MLEHGAHSELTGVPRQSLPGKEDWEPSARPRLPGCLAHPALYPACPVPMQEGP